MANIEITFDDEQFRKHLQYIRDNLGKEVMETVRHGAQEIENIAKETAPKQYGFLRASIGHIDMGRVTGSPKSGAPNVIGVWREEDDADVKSVEIGSGMAYARYMEYYRAMSSLKTKKRMIVKTRSGEGQSPYMAPAFAMVSPKVIKDITALMRKMLRG